VSKKKTVLLLSLVLLCALIAAAAVLAPRPQAGAATPGPPWPAGETLGEADGVIEEGEAVSPFADDLPAIANLDAALRSAMQDAASDAIADGVDFVVTSGWRSAAYQQSLLDAATIEYGSAELAAEFVLPPDQSRHVTGEAVDIGRTDANSWLSQHGADYGLCQTYANEMWHFELATTPGGECPAQLPNAAG
jgi:D-alanyl-D-alanine carboxypeptidase